MKNLISCFVLIAVSKAVSAQLFTRKDTLRFAADSSYSRAIARYNDNQLVLGTSKTGVILFNEETGTSTTLMVADPDGEYRDVIVKKKQCVYSMVSGKTGHIVRSFRNSIVTTTTDEGVFYDDVVSTKNELIVLGDPVNGHFFLRYQNMSAKKSRITLPQIIAFPDEACYAGSGTTAQMIGKHDYCFVSGGGGKARFHQFSLKDTSTYFVRDLPLALGDGAGPFSVCFTDVDNGVAVGGNYTLPNEKSGTATYTTDSGKTWLPAQTMPNGYRCCVVGTKTLLFCAGSNGIDYSTDGGKTWQFFDKGYFCALLLEKNRLYATTNKGYCLRYELNLPD